MLYWRAIRISVSPGATTCTLCRAAGWLRRSAPAVAVPPLAVRRRRGRLAVGGLRGGCLDGCGRHRSGHHRIGRLAGLIRRHAASAAGHAALRGARWLAAARRRQRSGLHLARGRALLLLLDRAGRFALAGLRREGIGEARRFGTACDRADGDHGQGNRSRQRPRTQRNDEDMASPPVRNTTIRRVNTLGVNKALSEYDRSTLTGRAYAQTLTIRAPGPAAAARSARRAAPRAADRCPCGSA